MALKDAVTTILNRNAFYRDGYRLLLRISVVQGIAIVLLLGALIALVLMMETRYVYFATTADGRIINIVPLDDPFLSRDRVISWAAGKSQEVMRLNYFDYRPRLQQAAANFTPTGWESFTRAMKEARIIEALEAHKLVMAMDIEAAPEIEKAFVKDGVYSWYVQFPVTIKFDGVEPPAPIHATLLMQIVRVSTLQNPDGISIEQWIAKVRDK